MRTLPVGVRSTPWSAWRLAVRRPRMTVCLAGWPSGPSGVWATEAGVPLGLSDSFEAWPGVPKAGPPVAESGASSWRSNVAG